MARPARSAASIPPDVAEAFDEATELFSTYTPEEVSGFKGRKRTLVIGWAYILDEYNNGLSGPEHCSE